jgi:hypothetical protein
MAKYRTPYILSYEDFVRNLANVSARPQKLDIYYNKVDSRCWSALLNQGTDNVIVTFHLNKDHLGHQCIDIMSSSRTMIGIEPEYVYDIIDELLTQTDTQED